MPAFRILTVLFFLALACWRPLWAAEEPLPPEQAFKLSASAIDGQHLRLHWDIAAGYHLYRKKFAFASQTPGVGLGEAVFPASKIQHDEFAGDMEIYQSRVDIELPLRLAGAPPTSVALLVTSQGCADQGVCYPPRQQQVDVPLPAASAGGSLAGLGNVFKKLGLAGGQSDLLPGEQAFRFFAEVKDSRTIAVSWQIADGYYLYREKFKFELLDAAGVRLGTVEPPHGTPMEDEAFGRVEVFHNQVAFELPLLREQPGALSIQLKAFFQGCADRGVCYPPMQQTVALALPPLNGTAAKPAAAAPPVSEQDRIADTLKNGSLWLTVLSFLGFGLLLAFTPCCFPMIPILSGIIVGHGHHLTTARAFGLSLAYVLASALTYTVFGVLAGLFGANLQTLFQQPAVLVAFALVFVALALSMFGFYELQLPSAIQSRLDQASRHQKSGSFAGAAVMGFLSTLIVGPCVAAPLAGALIYIGQTGDALLGGIALFSLGLGSGLPLLAIGASAGKLLPRAGHWMHTVKSVFGVSLLAVAVWLLERVLPASVTMAAWALLLIVPAVFMGALDTLPAEISGWRRLWKGLGLAMLTYGILLLIGAAADSRDPLQPLRGLSLPAANAQGAAAVPSLAFQRVHSLQELDGKLQEAQAQGRMVMLDYYADWCIACKEMERYTFADPRVRQALRDVLLLQADVTANGPDDAALLHRYQLIGPPATLFFGKDSQEKTAYRVVGYMEAERFLQHLQQVLAP
jgi:thiol:disulfide interchange protein DsbD